MTSHPSSPPSRWYLGKRYAPVIVPAPHQVMRFQIVTGRPGVERRQVEPRGIGTMNAVSVFVDMSKIFTPSPLDAINEAGSTHSNTDPRILAYPATSTQLSIG